MTTIDINPITAPTQAGTWIWMQGNPPPAVQQLRGDTANWATCTILCVSSTDANSIDQSLKLVALVPGDEIRLELGTDPTRWAMHTVVTNSGDQGGYYSLSVTPLDSNGNRPNDNTAIVATITHVAPPPPDAALGHMMVDITMQPNITQEIVPNLMDLFCEFLQTVTHLVNHVNMTANVGGVIITDSEDIVPASMGDLVPPAP